MNVLFLFFKYFFNDLYQFFVVLLTSLKKYVLLFMLMN